MVKLLECFFPSFGYTDRETQRDRDIEEAEGEEEVEAA
jgi:hypothetical protein